MAFLGFECALCSFGDDVLIRRERSSVTDFSYAYTNHKQTLFVFMTKYTK